MCLFFPFKEAHFWAYPLPSAISLRMSWALQGIELSSLSVAERLQDAPRPGAKPTFSEEQRCQIAALACEAPQQADRPISQWTGREIADELKVRGIVSEISPRHAARLLKKGASNRTASATG
jgi:hypothetical protein